MVLALEWGGLKASWLVTEKEEWELVVGRKMAGFIMYS